MYKINFNTIFIIFYLFLFTFFRKLNLLFLYVFTLLVYLHSGQVEQEMNSSLFFFEVLYINGLPHSGQFSPTKRSNKTVLSNVDSAVLKELSNLSQKDCIKCL